jgi:hypothetical protein
MKHVLLAVATAVAATMFLSAAAGAATVRGVVVSRSHGTLLVATSSGRVVALKGHAAIGSRLVGQHVVGHASRARIHGVVVKEKGSTMFVASNRHLVAIHRSGRGLAGSGSTSGPPPGTIVTSTVTVHTDGQLNEDDQGEDGQDSSSTVAVQATITAVGAGTVTVDVNGTDLTLDLPGGLTLPQSLVGQTVTINVSIDQGDDNSQGDE